MKKHFIISYIVIFMVFLLATSCTSNNNKSNNKEYNDTIRHNTPDKFSEEQEKDDMI